MPRIRTVKPSFFTSLTVARLPLSARLSFIGLLCQVDDEGRAHDDARLIKAGVWPLDDSMTTRRIERDLEALADVGLILRYEAEGQRFLAVRTWAEHQRISHPQESKLPPPDSTLIHGTRAEPSAQVPDTFSARSTPKGKEGKGKETSSSSSDSPPGPEPPDDDQADAGFLRQVWGELAQLRLARQQADPRAPAVGDEQAWVARVASKMAHHYGPEVMRWRKAHRQGTVAECIEALRPSAPPDSLDGAAAAQRDRAERNNAEPCPTCGARGGQGMVLGDDGTAGPCPECHPQ